MGLFLITFIGMFTLVITVVIFNLLGLSFAIWAWCWRWRPLLSHIWHLTLLNLTTKTLDMPGNPLMSIGQMIKTMYCVCWYL